MSCRRSRTILPSSCFFSFGVTTVVVAEIGSLAAAIGAFVFDLMDDAKVDELMDSLGIQKNGLHRQPAEAWATTSVCSTGADDERAQLCAHHLATHVHRDRTGPLGARGLGAHRQALVDPALSSRDPTVSPQRSRARLLSSGAENWAAVCYTLTGCLLAVCKLSPQAEKVGLHFCHTPEQKGEKSNFCNTAARGMQFRQTIAIA